MLKLLLSRKPQVQIKKQILQYFTVLAYPRYKKVKIDGYPISVLTVTVVKRTWKMMEGE